MIIKDTVSLHREYHIDEDMGVEININFKGIEIEGRSSIEKSAVDFVDSVAKALVKKAQCL